MTSTCRIIAALLLSSGCAAALAGRPLATDDAAVADTGGCQVETWLERSPDERAYVLAPACGIAERWELGADVTRIRSAGDGETALGLAVKWLPLAHPLDTPLGALSLGVKVALGADQSRGSGWRVESTGALALASLEFRPSIQIHLNLGPVRQRFTRSTHTLLNAAMVWAPIDKALLFAEVQAADTASSGGTVRTAGGRWWLQQDRLGLDVTVSRQSESTTGTRWTLGLGWYRLGL